MQKIELLVNDSEIQKRKVPKVVTYTENVLQCSFTFNSTWDTYNKVAIFWSDDETSKEEPIVDGICNVPKEVLVNQILKIGVRSNNDGFTMTTNLVKIQLEKSCYNKLVSLIANSTVFQQLKTYFDGLFFPLKTTVDTHTDEISQLNENNIEIDAQLAEKADKSEVTNVMTPKGTLAYASLPTTGNTVGWYYYCPDGDGTHGKGNYVWNGTAWYFGGTGDDGYNILNGIINESLHPEYKKINLCNGNILIGYARSNNSGQVSSPWVASGYISGICNVSGLNFVTLNGEWVNNPFGFFANDKGNVISLATANKQTDKTGYVYAVPNGATKLYFSYNAAQNQYYQTHGIVCLSGTDDIYTVRKSIIDYPYGDSSEKYYFADNLRIKSSNKKIPEILVEIQNVTENIYYVEKDGSGDFTSLVTAINTVCKKMDTILYVGKGTWDIIAELGNEYVESVNSAKRGLTLKNRVHVICSSQALITCHYTGTRADTITWLSVFNAGEYGFTLENARIESSNCRYSVHDERDTQTDFYENKYINCYIKHDHTIKSGTFGGYPQCIGGGLGTDGHVVIDNCIFENTALLSSNKALVSYHNSWGVGRSNVVIKGNYLKGIGCIRLIWFGSSTEITPYLVHDNSLGSAIEYYAGSQVPEGENTELLAWNNVIRA